MKKTEPKLYSIRDYAKLCGVSRAAIYQRLENKTLTATSMSNGRYKALVIDAGKFPPEKREAGRKPFKLL